MAKFNVLTATATELEAQLRDGQVTSEQIVAQYLGQIHKYNGYLHAVISTPPEDNVLGLARKLDQERSSGRVRGPLHGIPILVKDNTATHPDLGMDTTSGTYALVGSRVRENAPFIKKELSNFRGSNMHNGWSAVGGLTQSPYVIGGKRWDDGHAGHSAVGGSSSGSCAGVAAGFAPISIGTDTNASILTPATRNDVYAMKPTHGLVSNAGIVPISTDFDSAGPIARCARDIAIMMDEMVDDDKVSTIPQGTFTSQLTGTFDGIRIGVLDPTQWHLNPAMGPSRPAFDDQVDKEVASAYEKLRSLGAVVKEVTLPPLSGLQVDGVSQITTVMDSQFKKTFNRYLAELDSSKVRTLEEMMQFMRDHADLELPEVSPNLKRLEAAATFELSDEDYKKALDNVRDFGQRRAIDKCLQDNDVDIIIGRADSKMNHYYVSAGYPMAVVPLGYADYNGRPFGVCAIAGSHQEGRLIQFMSAWQKVFNTERRLPTWIGGDPGHKKSEL